MFKSLFPLVLAFGAIKLDSGLVQYDAIGGGSRHFLSDQRWRIAHGSSSEREMEEEKHGK